MNQKMDFYQRRRIVLTSFAIITTIFLVMAAVWHTVVLAGLRWLFSDSIGAVILLSLVSLVLAIKARRRMTLDTIRRTPPGEGPARSFSTPAAGLLLKLVLFVGIFLILALIAWSR